MEANEPFGVYGQALSLASKDHVEAKKFLERACDLEHAEALGTMAEWLWEESSHAAVALWRRAAELGHSQSRSRLGSLLMHGVAGRVEQDQWEGKRLLRLAFEQDDPDAAWGAKTLYV